jgi:hypothetical protein
MNYLTSKPQSETEASERRIFSLQLGLAASFGNGGTGPDLTVVGWRDLIWAQGFRHAIEFENRTLNSGHTCQGSAFLNRRQSEGRCGAATPQATEGAVQHAAVPVRFRLWIQIAFNLTLPYSFI